jgi:hypothetical protein
MATSGSGREVVYGFQDITTVKRSAVVLGEVVVETDHPVQPSVKIPVAALLKQPN